MIIRNGIKSAKTVIGNIKSRVEVNPTRFTVGIA